MIPQLMPYPHIDPVAFRIFGFPVRWYALSYLAAFAVAYAILRRRLHHPTFAQSASPRPWTRDDMENLLVAGILGVVLGGRLGYVLFYNLGHYLKNPVEILRVNEGGMSFHGGLIGVALAVLWFAWRHHRPVFEIFDFAVPAVAPGLALGRLGNFINGELWGRPAPASLPWAMVFPDAGPEPRHPSQLYQFLGEGVLLAIIVLWFARKRRPRGSVAGLFLLGYGVFRFAAEYFREPDAQLGLLSLGMSMGQWLCVPMIVGGVWLLWWSLCQSPVVESEVGADESERGVSESRADEPAQATDAEN